MKRVAVICFNINDFKDFMDITENNRGNGDNTYIPIPNVVAAIGYSFNEVLETGKARLNPEYELLKSSIQQQIRK